MIFARYKGADEGRFTSGRVYVAKPEMDDAAVVGFGYVEVMDDNGQVCRVNPDDGCFEYLVEVYAVVLKPSDEFECGEVVSVDDASDDRRELNVKGSGFWQTDMLAILDRTNVFPGVTVCSSVTGSWHRVARVDEALWIVLEGQEFFRSPGEFRFAVSHDGELMMEPLVTCVDAMGQNLTEGKRYYLSETTPDGLLVIKNDDGTSCYYSPIRFRMG